MASVYKVEPRYANQGPNVFTAVPMSTAQPQPQTVTYAQPTMVTQHPTMVAPQPTMAAGVAQQAVPQMVYYQADGTPVYINQTQGYLPAPTAAVPGVKQAAGDVPWYRTLSGCGSMVGTPMAWVSLALIGVSLILHVVAVAYVPWTVVSTPLRTEVGLWAFCHGIQCTRIWEYPDEGATFMASQALALVILLTMLVSLVLFLIYFNSVKNKRKLEIATTTAAAIAALLLLVLMSLWDARIRRGFDGYVGPSFIIEIICFLLEVGIMALCIINYMIATKRL